MRESWLSEDSGYTGLETGDGRLGNGQPATRNRDLERIALADPLLMATVYKNVGRSLARQLEAATLEIRALST